MSTRARHHDLPGGNGPAKGGPRRGSARRRREQGGQEYSTPGEHYRGPLLIYRPESHLFHRPGMSYLEDEMLSTGPVCFGGFTLYAIKASQKGIWFTDWERQLWQLSSERLSPPGSKRRLN